MELAFETRHRRSRVCVRARTCLCAFYESFFNSVSRGKVRYVRTSPWQRSGVIGEWNGAEMICGRWLDHGLSMMTSPPPPQGALAGGCSCERGVAARYFEGWRDDKHWPRFPLDISSPGYLSVADTVASLFPPPLEDRRRSRAEEGWRFGWNNGVEEDSRLSPISISGISGVIGSLRNGFVLCCYEIFGNGYKIYLSIKGKYEFIRIWLITVSQFFLLEPRCFRNLLISRRAPLSTSRTYARLLFAFELLDDIRASAVKWELLRDNE